MRNIIRYKWAPFILASIIYIFFFLKIYNLGIGFRDEGFLYLNVTRILSGEIPYRDFFMTTTPGSFYLAAFFAKIFGLNFITGRILFGIVALLCVYLVNLIYKLDLVTRYIASISIALYFLVPGAFGYYNVEALLFSLISFFVLIRGLDKKSKREIFLSGLLVSIVFLFKQSYGAWVGLGFFFIIFNERFKRKGIKDIFLWLYVLGGLFIAISVAIYFHTNETFNQFIYYAGVFSREVKAHRTPFIIKSVISLPILFIVFKVVKNLPIKYLKILTILIILALGFIFIKLGYGYFDITRIYYIIFLVFPIFILATTKTDKVFIRSSIFLLALFFANASSGRESGTILCVSPVFIPLTSLYLQYINKRLKIKKYLFYVLIAFLILSQALVFSWNSLDPNGKLGTYKMAEMKYELNNNATKYIKIPSDEKNEIAALLRRINKYPKNRKLLCFPYCPMMNVLTGRESPSYFNFFYPEAFLASNQNEVINNLESENTIVVIQRKGKIEPEAEYEDIRFSKLKKYIVKNYKMDFELTNFAIYIQ